MVRALAEAVKTKRLTRIRPTQFHVDCELNNGALRMSLE